MSLSTPQEVQERLELIEADLAERQQEYEDAAFAWFCKKRDKEKERATAFLRATGTVAERSAISDRDTATFGAEEEATYESLKAVMRTLEARATIGQSILRSQGRGG